MITYVNGHYVPFKDARVHLTDLGLMRAYAIFEVASTVHGVPFLLDKHCARLKRSAAALGITIPLPQKEIMSIVRTLIEKNNHKEAVIRIMVSGGTTYDVEDYPKAGEPFMAIMTEEFHHFPETHFTKGVKVATLPLPRLLPKVKMVSYAPVISLLRKLKKKGVFEVLHTHNGQVFEGGTSNFFMVKKGVVITPKDGVLEGITRGAVLALARKRFKVEERPVTIKELAKADEVFYTATLKGVMPITTIDGKKVGNGKVGPVTTSLIHALKDFEDAWVKKHNI